MALTKTLEIDLVGSSLELVYTDHTGTKLPAEEFPVCGIKSVKGIAQIGYGARDASNQRRMTYPFDDMLQVVVEMDQKNYPIKFDIQSVTNQAGWTPNAAGLDQAVADIIAWAATCGGSADVVAELASVIKAEDSIHVSGDMGVMALAVRNEGQVDLTSSDRDYSAISTDRKGNLIVSSVGKMTRIMGAANYSRAFTYHGTGTDNIITIVHSGTTPHGVETITETISYVDPAVNGSNVTGIVYS